MGEEAQTVKSTLCSTTMDNNTHLSVSPSVNSERQMPHGSPARATVLVSQRPTLLSWPGWCGGAKEVWAPSEGGAVVQVAMGIDASSSSVAPAGRNKRRNSLSMAISSWSDHTITLSQVGPQAIAPDGHP